MSDQKPPRLASDERTTLLALLQFQRASLVRKVRGVTDAADSSPVPSGTTLAWLVDHLADAESLWVESRFAGLEDAGMPSSGTDARSIASAVERYEATWARVDAVVAASDLDDLCRGDAEFVVNLRWVLLHLLEETARHAGHADVLRELIDGQTGR